MDEATKKGLKANERVVPESDAKKLKARIRELERMLGKQTMKLELLEEAVALAREKKWISGGNSPGESGGQ
jgi:transposase